MNKTLKDLVYEAAFGSDWEELFKNPEKLAELDRKNREKIEFSRTIQWMAENVEEAE
jgi:4-alpha-glucanotransferase